MEFQIGSAFIKVSLSDTFGNLCKVVLVVPISDKLMFAARAEISGLRTPNGSAIPFSNDSMVYKRGQAYPEDMVKGWIYNS